MKMMNSTLTVLLLWCIGSMAVQVEAATINVVYDPGGAGAVDPCSDQFYFCSNGELHQGPLQSCAGGTDRTGDLQLIVEAAADFYGNVFQDNHEVTMSFWWKGPCDRFPDASVTARDAEDRPIEARIRIPADGPPSSSGSPLNWYYDPSPESDEDDDLTMRPRLYRTVHPDEQNGAFDGAPPDVLEVAYIARRDTGAADLVTTVLHEMGHALGLSGGPEVGPGPACHGEDDPFFRPDPTLVDGSMIGIRAFHNDTPGQQCVHLELGGIQACKTDPDHSVGNNPDEPSTMPGFTLWECASHQALMWTSSFPRARSRPGIMDLLALAEAGGWQEIDLPRKYTAIDGDWNTNSTWIGNRVPGGSDDVYIVNQAAGTKIWDTPASGGDVANLYISENNTLRVTDMPFFVANRLTIAGPESETGPLRLPDEGDGDDDDVIAPLLTRVEVGSFSGDSGTLGAVEAVIEPGGVLQLHEYGHAAIGSLENGNVIVGDGTVEILASLDNFGTLRASGGTLTVATPTPPPGTIVLEPPVLNLGGRIQAIDGNVTVDGIVVPAVWSRITVGAARTLAFSNGWEQSSSPSVWLLLDGDETEALVSGASELNNLVEVNGLGRFSHDTVFGWQARLEMQIGGTEPGSEHSQLTISGAVELDGVLQVQLADGYSPDPLDSFAILQFGSRSGEFSVEWLPELDGGLTFMTIYEEERLRLLVGFEGADPDAPNCHGMAVSTQAQIHGNIKNAANFHGYPGVQQFQQAIGEYCDGS